MTINRKTTGVPKANSVSPVRKPPAAPPAYRPQPLPKVLQKKPNPAMPVVSDTPKNQAPVRAPNKVSTVAGSNSPVIQRSSIGLGLLAATVGGAIIYGIAHCLRGGQRQGNQLPNPQPTQPLTPITATSHTGPTTVTRPQHQAAHVSSSSSSSLSGGPPQSSGPPPSSMSSSIGGPPPRSSGLSSSSTTSGMPPRVTIEQMLAANNAQRNANYLGLLSDSRRGRTTTTSANNNNVDDDDGGGSSRTSFRDQKQFSGKSEKKYKKGQKGGVACYLNHSKKAVEQGSNSNYHQHAERLAVGQALSKYGDEDIHLEQNAWPCEYCHPWLRDCAVQKGITITVSVTDDHGGYAGFHKKAPDSTGTIVYHPDGRVEYQ